MTFLLGQHVEYFIIVTLPKLMYAYTVITLNMLVLAETPLTIHPLQWAEQTLACILYFIELCIVCA